MYIYIYIYIYIYRGRVIVALEGGYNPRLITKCAQGVLEELLYDSGIVVNNNNNNNNNNNEQERVLLSHDVFLERSKPDPNDMFDTSKQQMRLLQVAERDVQAALDAVKRAKDEYAEEMKEAEAQAEAEMRRRQVS